MNVIVVGGGASGIIAALRASKKNDVTILERNADVGKKILVTGNGRCNLWNETLFKDIDLSTVYNTNDIDKLSLIMSKRNDVYNYLTNELNIFTKNDNGYIYPYNNTAASVKELLKREIERNNIDIVNNCEVINIEKVDNKFRVYNQFNEYYECDKVIISCGTKASVKEVNNNYDVLSNLDKEDYLPSLVPLKCNNKNWKGIRCNSKLTLTSNNNLIKEEVGEIQLTEYGISGIVTFNVSSHISKFINNNTPFKLLIDFIPDYQSSEIEEVLNSNKDRKIEEVLETLLHYNLMHMLLNELNIDKNELINNINIKELIEYIKNYKVDVTETLGFDRAQVCTGGINLSEVNNNMEVDKVSGLYLTGEMLNVDGICGGYNLAFAFTTGFIAGDNLND